MARTTHGKQRTKRLLSDDVERIDEKLDRENKRSNYPIYILDFGDSKFEIVFPEGKKDLMHVEFWKYTVAPMVAKRLRLSLKELENLPYCQRRARICGKNVYYGEEPSHELLRQIKEAVGEKALAFVYEEHETRLEFDIMEFTALSQS